ncbi:glycoside hydrolase family 13 protein [Enterococcus massiliensis]|uniref:glycoside hydrolase family 13 protein n=1 Tax=Enterococcus massiliensis TaxID=1640685 RepID=UPI00065DCF2C|nr:alpha-glucosidase [Enterococcus massiliensis]
MHTPKWWQTAVIYQVYPRSFKDSNNDGIGDICGITSKLDYLQKLGITAIWLSPVYASPNVDNGYDISNYYEVMPEFGTMKDLEELITQAKNRNIRIIMDLVVNHTSNQHPWFLAAQNGEKKYQDYYIFRDKENINKIQSFFGGSAWQLDNTLQKYYFHLFASQQPDLNWANPELRKEIWKMMHFWLKKGIGGFRLDVIDLIGKDPDKQILGNGPHLHDYLHEMYQNVLKNYDVVTIGETGSVTPETAPLYTQADREELSMVFQFQHMALDEQLGKTKWDLRELSIPELKEVLSKWQTELPDNAWNSLFWSNHDQPRILSRWGNTQNFSLESGKMLAMILHLMRGTPFVYQGEEIGMTNQIIRSIDEAADIESINYYHDQLQKGATKENILASINVKGRDNARTPMQWSPSIYAGFSTKQPWYPVNSNYDKINAEANLQDKNSLFYTYQKLIKLRKENPIIVWGTYQLLETSDSIFAYKREYKNEAWLVCANFSNHTNKISFPQTAKETILSNYDKRYNDLTSLTLLPYETFVVRI